MDTRPTRLMRLPFVIDRIGFSKATLYAKIKQGEFPAPVQLTARCVAWRESDVDDYIASRKCTRERSLTQLRAAEAPPQGTALVLNGSHVDRGAG